MSGSPRTGFTSTFTPVSVYEYAPMSCMQAISRVTTLLHTLERAASASEPNMAAIAGHMLDVSRMADFLMEPAFQRQCAAAHSAISRDIRGTTGTDVRSLIEVIRLKWDELLRENDTRYIPSGGA